PEDRRPDRRLVERVHVVGLEERVDRELPVHRALGLVAREADVVLEAERGELALRAAEMRVDVDRLVAGPDEDQAVLLGDGEAFEGQILLRETGESLGARLADEASVVGIRPAVIRARETAGDPSRAR